MKRLDFALFLYHPPEYDNSDHIEELRSVVRNLCGDVQTFECERQEGTSGSGVSTDFRCSDDNACGKTCWYDCVVTSGPDLGKLFEILVEFTVDNSDRRSHEVLCPDFRAKGYLDEGFTPNGSYIATFAVFGFEVCRPPVEWDVEKYRENNSR
ncbi:hypothetical protein [Haloferula helveola]